MRNLKNKFTKKPSKNPIYGSIREANSLKLECWWMQGIWVPHKLTKMAFYQQRQIVTGDRKWVLSSEKPSVPTHR